MTNFCLEHLWLHWLKTLETVILKFPSTQGENPSEVLENETFLLLSFGQKTFVPFPFMCHKACTFAKLRLLFWLIRSQKIVPHVLRKQFLLVTKEIDLRRTEFTLICVYHFPLFLHCFQLSSFKQSSCHTHYFQFTRYAEPHTPPPTELWLHSLYKFSTPGPKSLFIYKLDVP